MVCASGQAYIDIMMNLARDLAMTEHRPIKPGQRDAALRVGADLLWLDAGGDALRQHGPLAVGDALAVDLRGNDVVCWPEGGAAVARRRFPH